MEVGIIEREEWRSVETSSGGESAVMPGILMTPLLCADNLDFQKKVSQFSVNVNIIFMHVLQYLIQVLK